jgi:hypothetical protein
MLHKGIKSQFQFTAITGRAKAALHAVAHAIAVRWARFALLPYSLMLHMILMIHMMELALVRSNRTAKKEIHDG